MYYIVIPSKKLIVGWNPKAGCTTIKATILKDLGFDAEKLMIYDELHKMIDRAEWDKEVPLYTLDYINNNSIDHFTKVCVVRNPYERLISGIRQRFIPYESAPPHRKKIRDLTVDEYIASLQQNNFRPDSYHFKPQTTPLSRDIIFDKVYDINDMGLFIDDRFKGLENKKYGGHDTIYDNSIETNYSNMKIGDIVKLKSFSKNPHQWFSAESIKIINELYKEDFEFCKKYGIEYETL